MGMKHFHIVDPLAGASEAALHHEKIAAALDMVSRNMHEAMAEIHDPQARADQFYQSWLVLDLVREANARLGNQISAIETELVRLPSLPVMPG